jgi:glycine/D-amino acid oxidase-like deaminating enzyme
MEGQGVMAVGSAYLRGARIVVIGAGAVGSVAAYRLAQAGAAVTVVEPRFPGAGTTGNSFAWLNSFNKTPRHYHRLNARSIRDHADLARELDGDWVHIDGGLHWCYADDAEQVQRLRTVTRRLHEWGYRIETVTPEQVMRELEPDLVIDPDRVEEVFYTPGEGWLNGVGLCHGALSAAVRRYGARLVQDTVVDLTGPAGAIDTVVLAGGERLGADAVINAAGPDAGRIAAMAGVDLPVSRQPGLLVTTEPAPVSLKRVIHAPEGNLRADGGWRMLIQRTNFDQLVESEQPLDVSHPVCQESVDHLATIVPGLRGIRAESARMGVRPMPKDGHPIVGFDPAVNGLYHLVMHSGVTLSATMGNLVVEDFLQTDPPELAPYRPARFTSGAPLSYAGSEE